MQLEEEALVIALVVLIICILCLLILILYKKRHVFYNNSRDSIWHEFIIIDNPDHFQPTAAEK